MVFITAIHLSGGVSNEHIARVRWRNPLDGETGENSRESMVDWIKNQGGDARVTDGTTEVQVGVVDGTPPYLRTYADKRWTNNLLSLPRY